MSTLNTKDLRILELEQLVRQPQQRIGELETLVAVDRTKGDVGGEQQSRESLAS